MTFHHRLVELLVQQDLSDILLLVITLLLQELHHVMQGKVHAIEHVIADGGNIEIGGNFTKANLRPMKRSAASTLLNLAKTISVQLKNFTSATSYPKPKSIQSIAYINFATRIRPCDCGWNNCRRPYQKPSPYSWCAGQSHEPKNRGHHDVQFRNFVCTTVSLSLPNIRVLILNKWFPFRNF